MMLKFYIFIRKGYITSTDMHLKNISVDVLDMIVLPSGWGGTNALAKDENIMTSRRPGTAICFALSIVKNLKVKKHTKHLKRDF